METMTGVKLWCSSVYCGLIAFVRSCYFVVFISLRVDRMLLLV